MNDNTSPVQNHHSEELLECERPRVFALMIAFGGFLGAYTFVQKGGVFCNAQTANFVMFAVQIGTANWMKALYYLIPISAYLLGTVISELLPKHINKFELMRWDKFFVGAEMLCVLAIGFVPDSAPPQICQVFVNFIASMQFNTFRQAKKIPMATTFCTNHLRQTGVHLVKWLRKRDDAAKEKFLMHALMITSFVFGGIASACLCTRFFGKAIWFSEILLFIVFIDLLHADLGCEKDKLHVVPHGH